MDEELLAALDADEEVCRMGRSAVFRRIVAEYLEQRRRKAISASYRKAYKQEAGALGGELSAWANEGVWPDN